MVYRKYHSEQSKICDGGDCMTLTVYVRIEGKWTRIGYYGSECKKFEHLDLQQEELDKQSKERMIQLNTEMRQIKQENRERRKTIENEFNMNKSFFKQQSKCQSESR